MTNLTIYGYNVKLDETTGTISGDTFKCKDTLKKVFDCKYNADSKTWTIDTSDIKRLLNHISVTVVYATNDTQSNVVKTNTNKPCPHCGTYCYGDCRV